MKFERKWNFTLWFIGCI